MAKPGRNTIAVLPFKSRTNEERGDYFSEGITEEIIQALARIDGLKVTSRTSSFFYKDQSLPLKEVAQQLGVAIILEGSIRIAGDDLRISAQLIEAAEDFHFWSESWDRKLGNIFEIQDEISLLIADKLREQIGHLEIEEHLVEQQTSSLDAYEYYLRAQQLFNNWNPSDVKTSIGLFEKALELDPKHTDSMVGLADAYGFMATTQFMPYAEAWAKASEYTQAAVKLNPRHAGAHYQLAQLAFFTKADFGSSFKHTRQAIDIQPNHLDALLHMAFLYLLKNEHQFAEVYLKRAEEIDPLGDKTPFYRAYSHYRGGSLQKALNMFNQSLEENPKNLPAITTKAYCLLKLGRYDELLLHLNGIPKEVRVDGDILGLSCMAYTMKGEAQKAEELLKQLIEAAKNPMAVQEHCYLFQVYAQMGENDLAFEWLDQAMNMKSSILLLGFGDPLTEPIQSDPRYKTFKLRLYGENAPESLQNAKAPLLDEDKAAAIEAALLEYLRDEEPYLNPSLSLRQLAALIEAHPNQVSWLINERLGKNFNQFINHYRVERFKQLASDPANSNITLIGLAYESGFNSKTVFNTYFKKETGLTPSQYLKQA